ncbi:uncharacterized protein K444DRAFT_416901 [Hyaloscypha bicolor E]|uniref:Uncharacterized protein n=1 Tax=Hyaloscypha bicolor E TaxID=1095630 RepID=A0A2J6T7A8_9HELO|nr:uncharacterized protein K444DRAFT_416901 [Hyaloscypha bicolor E]PMD58833.1 hypothetical protein K444DRAFT_416901 [Hyaloscypha bicolor E]
MPHAAADKYRGTNGASFKITKRNQAHDIEVPSTQISTTSGCGNTLASTTRKLFTPLTLSLSSTTSPMLTVPIKWYCVEICSLRTLALSPSLSRLTCGASCTLSPNDFARMGDRVTWSSHFRPAARIVVSAPFQRYHQSICGGFVGSNEVMWIEPLLNGCSRQISGATRLFPFGGEPRDFVCRHQLSMFAGIKNVCRFAKVGSLSFGR